jgi:hypothetical protein
MLIKQEHFERGVIRNRARAKQLRDFSGLRFGKITPTDIDGFLEFNDTLFVYIEAKQMGASLPYGQKLALVRMCNAIDGTTNERGQARVAAIVVVGHSTSADQDVDYARASVAGVYYKKSWQGLNREMTCREAIEALLGLAGLERYIK